MWHYLYFIVLVKVKDPTEFTGPESYVSTMIKVWPLSSNSFCLCPVLLKERNLDWFPRMRAMSLAADDGEGEQNEFRLLQSQLEITQKVVSTLSQQLSELKEQMTEQRKQQQRRGLMTSAAPLPIT